MSANEHGPFFCSTCRHCAPAILLCHPARASSLKSFGSPAHRSDLGQTAAAPAAAGCLTFWTPRTLHGSAANRGTHPRRTLLFGAVSHHRPPHRAETRLGRGPTLRCVLVCTRKTFAKGRFIFSHRLKMDLPFHNRHEHNCVHIRRSASPLETRAPSGTPTGHPKPLPSPSAASLCCGPAA